MKRIISVILAIALIAAILPTFAFAAEGEAEGIRIKYDLLGVVKKLGLTWESSSSEAAAVKRVPFTVLDFKASNGFFNFKNSSNGIFTGHSEINYNPSYGFQISSGDWIEFDIFVPKAGTYTMEMWCGNYPSDTKTRVYVNGNEVGMFSNYEENTVSGTPTEGQNKQFTKVVDEPRYIEGIKFEKAGLHTVKFHGSSNYCSAGTFYLIENETEAQAFLATVVAAADKTILSAGSEDFAKLTTKLFMNDGSAVADSSAYPISFRSDNEAVAKVSADGVVTPVGVGVANITAYTTNEFGEEVFATKKINVVDGVTITYDVIKHLYDDLGFKASTTKADGVLTKLDEALTNGFYSYAGGTAYDANAVKYYDRVQLMGIGTKMIFKINVPVAGLYGIDVDTLAKNVARCDADMNIYITKDTTTAYPKDLVGSYNVYDASAVDGSFIRKQACEYNFEEAGEYFISFILTKAHQPEAGNPYSYVGSFYLVGGEKNALMNGKISSTASEINVDEGESATVAATGFLSKDSTAATFTYSSNNISVATVDATTGVVTPVSAGKATITATANAEVANTLTTDITVTENKPGEAVTDTTVNVGVSAQEGGSVETSLENIVDEVEIGTKVVAEATAEEGYEFAYWADSNGKVLSANAKETFVINVNTSIKAYFEKLANEEETTAPVYFYNGNGEALGSETVEKGKTFADVTKPQNVSLTGFEFDKWSIADNTVINSLTRAVALFKETNNTYTVKVGGEAVAEGKKYGESVTVNATEADFTCWKLGDKVMSYNKSFTFNVYGDINLTKVCEGAVEVIPTVVLDTIDGEYFLTYNVPAGYTKLEAGILFANSGVPTIGSFYAKATEKTGSGQFTAKPNGSEAIARGYVIFRDASGSIRVIYS